MSDDNGTAREAGEKRRWRPAQFTEAQTPIMRALSQVLENAYPKPGVIIEALNKNGELLADGLREVINNFVDLTTPHVFKDKAGEFTLITDDADFDGKIKMSKLELVSVLEDGESPINGHVMRERAKRFTSFGRHAGQHLLNNWWELPAEMFEGSRDVKIVLPGTIWKSNSGGWLCSETLRRGGKKFFPSEDCLEKDFDSSFYFLRLKK